MGSKSKLLISVFLIIGCGALGTQSIAQFGILDDFKKKIEESKEKTGEVSDALKEVEEVKDKIEDTNELIDVAMNTISQNDNSIDQLYSETNSALATYNSCSDFILTKRKSTVKLTGASNSLSALMEDLPQSDVLNVSSIIEVPEDVCEFVMEVRELQDPKSKEYPVLKGPGRQEVSDSEEQRDVRIQFDYDKDAEFARIYYFSWLKNEKPFLASMVDLTSDESRISVFGRTSIPLSQSSQYYLLEHDKNGPARLNGYGPRMMALVQSDREIDIKTSSIDKWVESVEKAKKKSKNDVQVAITWLELYTPEN